MKIESGSTVTGDVKPVEGNYIRFVAEDGRDAFEVTIGKDGRSIQISGLNTFKVDGVLYTSHLQIEPRACNFATIRTSPYDG